jgi:hypothetical protein
MERVKQERKARRSIFFYFCFLFIQLFVSYEKKKQEEMSEAKAACKKT